MSKVTSFKDPSASGKRYLSPIVIASNLPLADRTQAEQKLVEAIHERAGLKALYFHQLGTGMEQP
jgi:hypothetical protein